MSQWLENDAQWYEQRMFYCDLCGRMIAKRYLRAEVAGEAKIFCSEDCESLYSNYLLPVRGPGYHRPVNVHEQYVERMVK